MRVDRECNDARQSRVARATRRVSRTFLTLASSDFMNENWARREAKCSRS